MSKPSVTELAAAAFSEEWEPTPEQLDLIVSAYIAAEEDSVSPTAPTTPTTPTQK